MDKRLTNVLLLYDALLPSVRLCAYEQFEYLCNQGELNLNHMSMERITASDLNAADVIVFVRNATSYAEKLAKRLKKKGKFIIYILDDDLLNISDGLASTQFYRDKAVRKRIQTMIQTADVFASPSINLLEKYKELCSGKTVFIEEPCLSTAEHLENRGAEKIRIGFAGSIDRSNDIDSILANVINKLHSKYKDKVEIIFMGAKPSFVEELKLKYYPYCDSYEEYQRMLSSLKLDIGLAPMPKTDFHACKHYNKFIEYASMGIVGVYSNVEPYTRVVKNGINGFLCDNVEEQWISILEKLIGDREMINEMRACVMKQSSEEFSIPVVAKNYIESIPQLSNYQAPSKKKIRGLFFLRVLCFIQRVFEFISRNGVRTPIKIVKKILKVN